MKKTMQERMKPYHIVWNTQSKNSGESMPLGGFDVGCNVWVEKNDILIYAAQSGAFDNEGRMCKAGRIRIHFEENVFDKEFYQELCLTDGDLLIRGTGSGGQFTAHLWCDAKKSALHMNFTSEEALRVHVVYETWRTDDEITGKESEITFCHRNEGRSVFDERIEQEGLQAIAASFPNVELNRTFGGILFSEQCKYSGTTSGHYGENDFTGYILQSDKNSKEIDLVMVLVQGQFAAKDQWQDSVQTLKEEVVNDKAAYENTVKWWHEYWEKSYVEIKPGCTDEKDKDWQVGRNYQLFRYMLGCNAYGEYPTKFNGSLFTVDPIYCSRREGFGSVNPDDRDWGGLIFTAQNQRLVYWPMMKNGDFDMYKSQFDFYLNTLEAMKARTKYFFELDNCACYPEQLDANGLSAFYGRYGLDYPLQVRYHYSSALEFAYMILRYCEFTEEEIAPYLDFVDSIIAFYDTFYPNKDESGKRIIFPSTALETFHASKTINVFGKEGPNAANYNENEVAVTNPADVIAALYATLEKLLQNNWGTEQQKERWKKFFRELPDIPREYKNGYEVVAPCEYPKEYVIGNCEIPQLYTVYPYHVYGMLEREKKLAQDTYLYAWEIPEQLLHISWHQNGIFAACLGLLEEARRFMWLKMADSGRRFPAFWGPGHDYVPDHNWGGSGMIAVQEMLVQTYQNKIYLLPTWSKEVDVNFKLWVEGNTYIECSNHKGEVTYKIFPESREKDVVVSLNNHVEERGLK